METIALSAIDSDEGRRALERSLEAREGSVRWVDLGQGESGDTYLIFPACVLASEGVVIDR